MPASSVRPSSRCRTICCLFLLWFAGLWAGTAAAAALDDAHAIDLLPYTEVLEDRGARLHCNNLVQPDIASRFVPVAGTHLFVDRPDSTYWLRIHVAPLLKPDDDRFVIYTPFQPLDRLEYFRPYPGTDCQFRRLGVQVDRRNVVGGTLDYRFLLEDKYLDPDEPVYLHVDNRSQWLGNHLPLSLYSREGYFRHNLELHLEGMAYYSTMLALLLFSAFILLRVRERSYLYYCGYLLVTLFVSPFMDGTYYTAWFPDAAPTSYRLFPVACLAQGILHLLFVRHLLFGSTTTFRQPVFALAALSLPVALLHLLLPAGRLAAAVHLGSETVMATGTLFLAATGVQRQLRYSRTLAGLLALHYGLLLAHAANLHGWLPDTATSPWLDSLAYASEALLFSLVLASQLINFRTRAESAEALQQQALEQVQREKQENIEKSRFLARASHDLRQPLHSLSLFAAALKLKTQDAEHRAIIDRMRESIVAMQELFGDMLDISRLELGTLNPHREVFALRDIISAIHSEASVLCADKGLTLAMQCPEGLCVDSDKVFLKRILRNFVNNAIRYTATGSIAIRCEPCGDRLRIDVIDTGIGIAPEHLPNLFDEFFRADGKDGHEGLGLGLAIVKRLADRLHHPLEVASTPGQGSRFSILLPLATAVAVHDAASPTRERPPGDELHGTCIAVIDDDASIRASLALLLELKGCRVVSGVQGEAVLQQCAATGLVPELLIVDYQLGPGENGVDCIALLRRHFGNPALPALLVTGNTSADCLQELQQQGHRVLNKPVDPLLLVSEMARALAGARESGRVRGRG